MSTDNNYRPSPALDYQEFMRGAEEWLRARGYTPLPVEYIVLPHALAFPPGSKPPVRSDAQKLEALRDKRDILMAQLSEVEEHITLLEAKLNRWTDCSG